jgi:predicted dehydrogenase
MNATLREQVDSLYLAKTGGMEMSKIQVGIVGLGWAASGHLIAFEANPDAEVVAVCSSKDLNPEQLREMCGNDATLYHDYDEFLQHPGLQVVDICTPHFMHPEQTIKAAQAGKHVMIEKPMALSYDSLLAMRDAIHKAGVNSTVFFELRFIPHFELINACMDQGLLGDVHYLEVDYYHGVGPWYGQYGWNIKKDKGGSSLLTAGCHALDAMLYFSRREVEEVYARSTKSSAPFAQAYEYDTTSVTLVSFDDGSVGKCTSSIDCRQPYVFNIKLVGSEGTLWNDQVWSEKLPGLRADQWVNTPTAQAESGDVLDHPYGPQIDHFINCLKEGRPNDFIGVDEAFKTHRVVFAIEKSLAEGRPVKISELPI